MRRSIFDVPRMDCPSEERIIRLALDGMEGVALLTFDLGARQLTIHHECDETAILHALEPLGFEASLRSSAPLEQSDDPAEAAPDARHSGSKGEASVLKLLLTINAFMFLIELAVGLIASSTGLIADSLDMFADASIYGISLYAVGRGAMVERRAASLSGWLQILLATLAFLDILRRVALGSEPVAPFMVGMAALALVANVTCLALLYKHRRGGVHMKASWIFSANDVIANAGVIVGGVMVALVERPWPDLVVGSIIVVLVFRGGARILRLASGARPQMPVGPHTPTPPL